MKIGDWVRRDRVRAKWHLVESVVAGDAVTRCGLRMKHRDRRGWDLTVVTYRAWPEFVCLTCS